MVTLGPPREGRKEHGGVKTLYGESSPGCRKTGKLLYFHVAERTCTQPRPEQTLGVDK